MVIYSIKTNNHKTIGFFNIGMSGKLNKVTINETRDCSKLRNKCGFVIFTDFCAVLLTGQGRNVMTTAYPLSNTSWGRGITFVVKSCYFCPDVTSIPF